MAVSLKDEFYRIQSAHWLRHSNYENIQLEELEVSLVKIEST